MAKSIVQTFPVLRCIEGNGYVSYLLDSINTDVLMMEEWISVLAFAEWWDVGVVV